MSLCELVEYPGPKRFGNGREQCHIRVGLRRGEGRGGGSVERREEGEELCFSFLSQGKTRAWHRTTAREREGGGEREGERETVGLSGGMRGGGQRVGASAMFDSCKLKSLIDL